MNNDLLLLMILVCIVLVEFAGISFGKSIDLENSFNYDKQNCELLIFDQSQPTVEGKEWAKRNLDECVGRGFITQELADMAKDVTGYGTASVTMAYQFAKGDIWKTIKILQDPNFPNNISSSNDESLAKGETLGDVPNTFGWFVLAMSLFIVFTYVIMKIKRRRK